MYLTVEEVVGTEVVCTAASDAILDGLLMVFHTERSNGACLPSGRSLEALGVCWQEAAWAGGKLVKGRGAAPVLAAGAARPTGCSPRRLPAARPLPAAESLSNLQNDLPVLTDFDKQAIATLCKCAPLERAGAAAAAAVDGPLLLTSPAHVSPLRCPLPAPLPAL